jgi:hypothetical protein
MVPGYPVPLRVMFVHPSGGAAAQAARRLAELYQQPEVISPTVTGLGANRCLLSCGCWACHSRS